MRKTLFIIVVICFACKGENTKSNSESYSKYYFDVELIGTWKSDMTDETTKNNIGNVTMTFTENGNLIYDIMDGEKVERMNLTYYNSDDTIVSDQPSHPQKQKTKYKIKNDKLTLEFEGTVNIFKREK
jgi:hypothetical protein